jgi:hypothetical protein
MAQASLTLSQFEKIDGLYSILSTMDDFGLCEDPRAVIKLSNRLFDACVDAIGYAAVSEFSGAEECAATILSKCLTGARDCEDREAV